MLCQSRQIKKRKIMETEYLGNVTDLILILLRGIAVGDYEVLTDERNTKYVAIQCKDWPEHKDMIKTSLIDRLQYELYGEFPLSADNQSDWDRNISKALNLGDTYRNIIYNGGKL